MAVLTQDEFEKTTAKRHRIPPKQSIKSGRDKTLPDDCYKYSLLHPENGIDDYQNFEDVINIDGKNYKRICKNGILETTEDLLAEFLMLKGYKLMEKKKI